MNNINSIDLSRLLKAGLDKEIEDGFVRKQKHPDFDLYILNYSASCQYERHWNDITLNCRALVVDGEYNVISRGFPKFFNYSELDGILEGTLKKHATGAFEVYEKMDGSYIGVFWYNGELVINSRGSFTSPHVEWAKAILETKNCTGFNLLHEYTYALELVHPENRIVVNYGDTTDLIFLARFNNESGADDIFCPAGFKATRRFDGLSKKGFEEIVTQIKDDEEGVVVKFENGFRCKFKGEEYCRLHKWMTNLTTIDVWEALKSNKIVEMLELAPDEMYDIIRKYQDELLAIYHDDKKFILRHFEFGKNLQTRKEFATFALQLNSKYAALLFNLYDNKTVVFEENLWKQLRPESKKLLHYE